jgi:DNA end-binding protein Ku
MALRGGWKGFLRLSLVSVPVRAFSAATAGDGRIHLHQLHETCHSRIRYEKVCPLHGAVTKDEIVSGFEYAKGKYVVVEEGELDRLRTAAEKAINIDTFVPPEAIDPLYFDGRAYYLLPDGPAGNKPYALLSKAMEDAGRYAIAQVVITGREQIAAVRSIDGLLSLSILNYASQIKKPSVFADELPELKASAEEQRLARSLIDQTSSDKVDLAKYRDTYTEKLTALIEAKIAGEEIVAPPREEEVPVINLMDALRESVARASRGTAARPPKKLARSRRPGVAARRKRKSS